MFRQSAGWIARHDQTGCHVAYDDRAGSYDGLFANPEPGKHNGARTDERALSNRHLTRDPRTGCEMHAVPNHTIMIHGSGCIDDYTAPQSRMRAHGGLGEDLTPRTKGRILGNEGCSMDNREGRYSTLDQSRHQVQPVPARRTYGYGEVKTSRPSPLGKPFV